MRSTPMETQFSAGATLIEIECAKLFAHEDHPEAFAGAGHAVLVRCFTSYAVFFCGTV